MKKAELFLFATTVRAFAWAVVPDYQITVPVICGEMERQGGRDAVIEQVKRLDASRVLLACDWYQMVPEKRTKVMARLRDHCAAFKRAGLEVGAWNWSFHCTRMDGFTPMTGSDGWKSTVDPCPLDPAFQKMAGDYIADLVRTGVDLVLMDDDFGFIFKNDAEILCCCDRHLERIRRRLGERVSPAKLKESVMSGGPNRYRDAWMAEKGESLKEFAAVLRRAADAVNPSVRLGLCAVHSVWDLDGVDAETIARILAGPNRPFLRLIGAPYWAMLQDKEGLQRLQHVIEYERMERSWCGDDLEIVGEGDTFPRPRWNCPASYLELFDLALRADGRFSGIMKYGIDYHSRLSDEPGYVVRHERDRMLLADVARAFSDKRAVGVRIVEPRNKIASMTVPDDLADNVEEIGDRPDYLWRLFKSAAAHMMSDCGIPTVYEGEGIVSVAFGPNASALTDADLKRGVILDVWAARTLADRGVDVGIRDFGKKKVNVSRELFEGDDIAFQERFRSRRLTLDSKCETDSWFLLDCDYQDVGVDRIPAAYFYENGKGERFFVFSFDAYCNGQGMNRSYPRARQLRRAVERLSGRRLPAVVDGNPDLYVMAKDSASGERAVGLWNCFADDVIAPVVQLDRPYSRVDFLGCRGRLEGSRVVLEDISAWKFAGFVVSAPVADGRECRIQSSSGDATARIQAAVDDCFRAGGGTVRVAKGDHEITSVRLRSNVTLYLEREARLVASRDPSAYDGLIQRDAVEPFDGASLKTSDRFERTSTNHWNNGIIRVYRAQNVAIIGEPGSEIDGRNCFDEKGEEGYRGPHGISMHFVSNVVCRGYAIRNTGNWSHRICLSSDIIVENVTIRGGHDGLDFHGCDRIRVENCDIQSGDDCIAGFDNDVVDVRKCRLNSACSIFRLGGRHVRIDGVEAYGPAVYCHRYGLSPEELRAGTNPVGHGRRNTLSFFTNYSSERVRGAPGDIEFRNCRVDGVDKFMHYNMSGNEQWQKGPGLRDVTFENVVATGLVQPLTAYAKADTPLRMALRNCSFEFREPVTEFIRGARIGEIVLDDVSIHGVSGPFLLKWLEPEPTIRAKGLRGLELSVRPAEEPFVCKPI